MTWPFTKQKEAETLSNMHLWLQSNADNVSQAHSAALLQGLVETLLKHSASHKNCTCVTTLA